MVDMGVRVGLGFWRFERETFWVYIPILVRLTQHAEQT
jgi:hypothetical protein